MTVGSLSLRQLLATAAEHAEGHVPVDGESFGASRAVLTQCILLAIALAVGRWLEKRKVAWLGEAGVALLLGIIMGMLSRAFTFSSTYTSWMQFQTEFFFIALLPPIMFEAGFSLQVKPFFRNIGAISALAFAGTLISTSVVGLVMWSGGRLGISHSLTFVEALIYGSIISTTDTVTIVAVLQRLGANEDLYALVFGESCLNDAVGIVLYRTLTIFLHRRVSTGSVFAGIGSFLGVFLGSMAIGVGIAFTASLIFKTKFLRHHHLPLESCMVVIFAYSSYMLADSLGLSGIVSILFCGLVSAHYVRPNISRNARDRTSAFFKVLSVLSEIFVFIYIGTSISMNTDAWRHMKTWSMLGVALVALALSRAANVWPCTSMVNYFRPPELRIPPGQQLMIWFSGMRGAMAFAMALRALEELSQPIGHALLVCTFFVVLFTVLFNGGASAWLMAVLKLRAEDEQMAVAHKVLGFGEPDDSRHVHMALGEVDDSQLRVEPSEASAISVGRSEGSMTSGYSSGYESESGPPTRNSSFSHLRPSKVLHSMRELSRKGVLTKLEDLDNKYLHKFFLGAKISKEIELSEMSSQGDDDSPHHSEVDHKRNFSHLNTQAGSSGPHVAPPGTPASWSASSTPTIARSALATGGHNSASTAFGHYADTSRVQPGIPEELMPEVEDDAVPLFGGRSSGRATGYY